MWLQMSPNFVVNVTFGYNSVILNVIKVWNINIFE